MKYEKEIKKNFPKRKFFRMFGNNRILNDAVFNVPDMTLAIWIVALVGMFFLARGITGNIIQSVSLSNDCSIDKECKNDLICCVINGIGSCTTQEVCNELTNYNKEKPKSLSDYNADIGLGLLILLCILIASYSTIRSKKNRLKKKKKFKRILQNSKKLQNSQKSHLKIHPIMIKW